MKYNNYDITTIYYSGYTITSAYGCGGYNVFETQPTPPLECAKLTYTYCGSEQDEHIISGAGGTLTSGETNNQRLHPSSSDTKLMKRAIVGECVTEIGDGAFNGESCLSYVELPSGLTKIGNGAFNQACFTAITIPNSVTTLGSAFLQCRHLKSIIIPSGVTKISYMTFTSCNSLSAITIPSGVTSIGMMAFENCSGLTSITCNAVTPPSLGSDAFKNTNNCPIYVPAQSLSTYKSASGWSQYASRIQPIT